MKKYTRELAMLQRFCFPCILLLILASIFACSDSNKSNDGFDEPFDPSQEVKLLSFYPDSGGMSTNVMIDGLNFGTDPSKVKVFFNQKEAAVVSARGSKLYAITPRLPGDTCVVSVVVDNNEPVSFDQPFYYHAVTRVTTIAGNPNRGSVVDGSLISAGFQDPCFLAVDAEDNIFVADRESGKLRRINLAKNEVTTINRGGFVGGRCNIPTADAEGKVILLAMDEHYTFYEFDPERLWEPKKFEVVPAEDSRYFKSEWKHSASACQLDKYLYYRSWDGEVIKFDAKTKKGWLVEERINPSADGYGVFSTIHPHLLYFTFRESRNIGVFNVLTNEYTDLAGTGKLGHQDGELADAGFGALRQSCFDAEGNLYVADAGSHCIRMVSPEGVVSTVIGIPNKSGYQDGSPEVALFNEPSGVTVLSDGTIYIADRENKCIRKLAIE